MYDYKDDYDDAIWQKSEISIQALYDYKFISAILEQNKDEISIQALYDYKCNPN